MDDLDRAIVNTLQDGVAVTARPFRRVAQALGTDETRLLCRLRRMLAEGVLTRFGPMFNADRMGGAFCLCAMRVPTGEFDRTARVVNAFPEVAHNYARDHELNMWFVLATDSPGRIAEVVRQISEVTGFEVYEFPKLEEFHVDLRLTA